MRRTSAALLLAEGNMEKLDEQTLKRVLKQALVEVLEERRDLFIEMLSEAVEDYALAVAMEEVVDLRSAELEADLFDGDLFSAPEAQA